MTQSSTTSPVSSEHAPLVSIQPYEWLFLALGIFTGLWLILSAGPTHLVTLEVLICTIVFGVCIVIFRKQHAHTPLQRVRLASGYIFALWFFNAIARVIPALGRSAQDKALLGIDRMLFGETPATFFSISALWTEVMSASYLSYLLYIHIALLLWLLSPLHEARRFCNYLFVAFAVGYVGYLLVPALGPRHAFPQLFSNAIPLMQSGISSFNELVVTNGSAKYDVFPSLHMYMTCVLLDYDFHRKRLRFYWMLPICILLFVSTLYLRYHYAIDLIAGVLWFLGVRTWYWRWESAQTKSQGE